VTFIKILEDAAAPLLVDRRGSSKLLIGVLLSLVPVVSFFALGYVLVTLRDRLDASRPDELPEWRDFGGLFLRGVVFFMVILAYGAVPFLFTSASFAMLKLGFVFFPPAVITLALSAVLWLLAIYIMPLALILLERRHTVRAVVDLREIWQRSSLILSAYIQATILNLAVLAVFSLPASITPAGYILSAPLLFLGMVYMAGVYGSICRAVFPRP
jgi:hypothetical protein